MRFLKQRSTFDNEQLREWLKRLKWTPELVVEWQRFFNEASRTVQAGDFELINRTKIPKYEDLQPSTCNTNIYNSTMNEN